MIMAMMKSSNTEWLGDIPAEWDVAQIGNYYELRNEKVSDYDFEPLPVTMKGIVPQLATAAKSDDHSNRKLVKKGDFVINSRSDRRGSCGISPLDGSVSLINIVMEPRGVMNPQYYNWLFHTEQFADEFYKWGHGIVDDLWTTRWQEMKKILIVAPSPDEQQAIADYLDETCSKIDEIIAEAKASIDEYKELKQSVIFEAVTKGLDKNVEMKDSGVEWIGEIPVDWNIAKINRVAWTTSGATPLRSKETEYYDNAVIRWVRTLDLNNGHVTDSSEKITETALKNSSCSIMPVKTVCVAMYGGSGTIGKSGILEVECATNQAICSIVSDKKVLNPDYLHYVIMAVRKYWMKYAVGTRKDPNINQQIIAQMRIPIPQLSKQDIIVNHLDKVTDKCDSLISEKESLINDLEAYKKSLIYEVVTGKRRVV
jgi:type I restriction enzyme S subunit